MIFKQFSSCEAARTRRCSSSRSLLPVSLMPLTAGATVLLGVTSSCLQVQAASMSLGNGGVRFDVETTLESEFIESHGAYQSTFGVINLETNEKTPLLIETKGSDSRSSIFNPSSKINDLETPKDFLGTPGNVVTQTTASYKFKAKTDYVFYLESSYNGRPTGIVYSTDALNPDQEQQVTFTGSVTELCQTGMILAWDDTGSKLVRDRERQDRDYDDFIVRLRNTACPIGGGEDNPPVAAEAPPVAPPIGGGTVGGRFPAELGLLAGLFLIPSGRSNGSRRTADAAVPEPMTILASAGAIGFATLMHRRRKKRDKDS